MHRRGRIGVGSGGSSLTGGVAAGSGAAADGGVCSTRAGESAGSVEQEPERWQGLPGLGPARRASWGAGAASCVAGGGGKAGSVGRAGSGSDLSARRERCCGAAGTRQSLQRSPRHQKMSGAPRRRKERTRRQHLTQQRGL